MYCSPVSGEVIDIIRGDKRRLEEIRILPDKALLAFIIVLITSLACNVPAIPANGEKIPSVSQLLARLGISGIKHLKQGVFFLKLKLKICPSKPLIAAEISFFLYIKQKSFIKYLVLKLSVPSQIMSNFLMILVILFLSIFDL